MKAYYLTGICTGAVNTGECNTPDLNGACVLHGKNLLKVPHGKKNGLENSCTIHGFFPTFSKTFPQTEKNKNKRRNVILL